MGEAAQGWVDRWGLCGCLFVAIALRVAMLSMNAAELTRDRDAYLGIAGGVVAGRGFCDPDQFIPTAFRPPLYPLQLAGVMMVVVVGAAAVAIVNLAWGLVSVWATWRIGRMLDLGLGSSLAALLVAVDPLLLQYAAQPMTETMCTGLVSLLVLGMVRLGDPAEALRGATIRQNAVGALFGLLVLCRPTFWPLAGLVILVWSTSWVVATIQRRDANLPSVPWRIAVGVILVVGPWVVRNQLVFGVPIVMTTHGGYTLLLGNNPVFYNDVVDRGSGAVWRKESFDKWQDELQADLRQQLGPNATELDRDRWQSQRAWRFMAAEPKRFLRAVWYRVRSLWSSMPRGEGAAGVNPLLLSLVGWYYAAVLLAFACGLVRVAMHAKWSRWWTIYLVILTVQLVQLVYWTDTRMRAPLTPAIGLFAAAAFCQLQKSA